MVSFGLVEEMMSSTSKGADWAVSDDEAVPQTLGSSESAPERLQSSALIGPLRLSRNTAAYQLTMSWHAPHLTRGHSSVTHTCSPQLRVLMIAAMQRSRGQDASALNSMEVPQIFQVKLLRDMEETGPDPALFRKLSSTTDLALRATKVTFQQSASLVVLEPHLWLNLMDIKDTYWVALLDSSVSPTRLLGSIVDGFTQRFTEA